MNSIIHETAAFCGGFLHKGGETMYNSTLCYLENDRGEYLMLHRVKKKKDVNPGFGLFSFFQ